MIKDYIEVTTQFIYICNHCLYNVRNVGKLYYSYIVERMQLFFHRRNKIKYLFSKQEHCKI